MKEHLLRDHKNMREHLRQADIEKTEGKDRTFTKDQLEDIYRNRSGDIRANEQWGAGAALNYRQSRGERGSPQERKVYKDY